MDELSPRAAWAGLDLPLAVGGVTLTALPEAPMVSVAPFRGRSGAVADALGAPLPEAGRIAALTDGSRVLWSGLDQWFLRGPAGDVEGLLAGLAAVTDQSDGWTALALVGPGAAEVLARLVPVDLDPAAFQPGAVARTQLRHMMCVLIAVEDGFEILVMRSFTRTAVHDIAAAMRAVAARAQLAR